MLFTSKIFIFEFLPLLIFIYYFIGKRFSIKSKNVLLLLGSWVFFCWGGGLYVLLIIGYSVLAFLFGNLSNNGLNILFQRDSFGTAYIPYFALSCNSVYEGQLDAFINEDEWDYDRLDKYIDDNNIDYIITIKYASHI